MRTRSIFLTSLLLVVGVPLASANTDQLKVYRKVYPDLKPSCLYCHVDKAPKKDDGKHDLNAYGEWLKGLMAGNELTEEMVKTAGRHDEFKAAEEVTTEGTAEPEGSTENTDEATPE